MPSGSSCPSSPRRQGLGKGLQRPLGALAAAAVLGASLLPYLRGARGQRASRCYLWSAVVMLLLAVGAYFAVQVPLRELLTRLRASDPVSLARPPG